MSKKDEYVLRSLIFPGWGLAKAGKSTGEVIGIIAVVMLVLGLWPLAFLAWLIGLWLTVEMVE